MSGGGLALVKASKSSRFAEGDVVNGMVPWSSYFIADTAAQVGASALRVCVCV